MNTRMIVAGTAIAGAALTALPATATPPASQAVRGALMEYFHAQDRSLLPGSVNPATALRGVYATGPVANQVLPRYQVSTAESFRRWVAGHRDRYRSITTAFQVQRMTLRGPRATATVYATTTMRWSPTTLAAHVRFTPEKAAEMAELKAEHALFGVGDVVTSKVATTHKVTLVLMHGRWLVADDRYNDPLNVALAADHVTPATAQPAPPARPAQQRAITSGTAASVSYARAKAAAYADKYWNSYNPKYVNYNPSGGDCANFVSQSMYDIAEGADAPAQNPYWYYNYGDTNPSTASPQDWRYAPSQHDFFLQNPLGATYTYGTQQAAGTASATLAKDQSSMQRGDVFYYDFTVDGLIDHTTIQVAALSDGTSLIDAHNTNRYHTRYDLGTSTAKIYLVHIHSTLYYKTA